MSTMIPRPHRPDILYPDSDGQPMADNTLQFEYIVTIKGGLEAQFIEDPNVFIAGDLLWYPVEGQPTIRVAPDILAAFGRPKGYRGSYKQWEEGGIPPQVVMEIRSPGNRFSEMLRKFHFYEQYGVEEYYLYDPDMGTLEGWLRHNEELREIASMAGWVSPRLQVRFELAAGVLKLYHPDGRPFASYVELEKQRTAAEVQLQTTQAQAEQERRDREAAQAQAARLAAQLRALGIEPEV